MKICGKCKLEKDLSEYYQSKNSKSGYQSYCKNCSKNRNEYMKRYRELNNEKIKISQKQWYSENRENQLVKFQEYYNDNVDSIKDKHKAHYENNKYLYLHYSKKRKNSIKRAIPSWLDEGLELQIKEIYKLAAEKSKTGTIYHVDHIVPLNGKNVCGLHVPWNLQVITAEENLRKSNKHDNDISPGK